MSMSVVCPDNVPVMSAMTTRSRWTKPRIARAAFRAGMGHEAADIARDDLVNSHAPAVREALRRYGIAFMDRPAGNLRVEVPANALAALDAFARARRQTPEALVGVVVRILASDTTLLANVLDDEA